MCMVADASEERSAVVVTGDLCPSGDSSSRLLCTMTMECANIYFRSILYYIVGPEGNWLPDYNNTASASPYSNLTSRLDLDLLLDTLSMGRIA